jgi:hypothetical protein
MINLPYWLEIAIYFVMAGLFATILKFSYEIYTILKTPKDKFYGDK